MLRELPPSASRDKDRLVPLVAEVTQEGHSVLVFCATRKSCETCAAMIAELLPQVSPKDPGVEAALAEQRQALVADMKEALGGAVTGELEKCILQGVAFHHAGLTAEERAGVERGYRSGCLQVLTATSTLAAGINLPARRVILRSLQQGLTAVPRWQYLQMVGRAGRAGQSAVGESFIIGQGGIGSKEWNDICALLTAPVPSLRSQILPESALQVEDLSSGLMQEHTQCLQRLLLEAVANGSVSAAQDIADLLHCTFAAQQHPYHIVHAATVAALTFLSTKGSGKALLELHEGTRLWGITHKGRAVYDSGLPLELAIQLYDDLKRAEEGVVLSSSLHLLYQCMLDHSGFQISSWARWHDTLERLPEDQQRVAEAVGVSSKYAQLVMRAGRRADAQTSARHARFAAALAINDLMCERSVTDVVEKWGQREFVSTAGISRGQMQKLQLDVSKYMGMAALLCETAGWWPLGMLYTNMSQIAAAGVRQELLGLMKVPGMNAGRARVLFKAGFKDAQALAVADPAVVEKALVGGLAQQMKGRAGSGGARQQAGGESFAPTAMARRAAQALTQSAMDYILHTTKALADLMEEFEEEGGDSRPSSRAEGEPELTGGGIGPSTRLLPGHQGQQPHGHGPGQGGLRGLTAEELADVKKAVNDAPPTPGREWQQAQVVSIALDAQQTWTKGLARVTQIHPGTPADSLEQFLSLWSSQPRFTLALHLIPGSPGQLVQALAVCWQSDAVYYVDLSTRHCARKLQEGVTLQHRVTGILGRQGSHKLCFDAMRTVHLLQHHAGMHVVGPVEDPKVAAWLLAPDSQEEATLKGLHATMAAKFQVRVPSLSKAGVTSTCRAALLTLAVMDPLKQLLAAKGMLEAFTSLEMPAALAAARVSSAAAALLPAAAVIQAQSAVEEAMRQGIQRLQERLPFMQDVDKPDTIASLLGSMRLAQPPRSKHGRPVITLKHLQLLLQRCRPNQREEIEVLQCLIHHKLLRQALAEPLAALLAPAGHPADEQQQQLQPPVAGSLTPRAASAAPCQLRLCTLTPSGQPDWGQPHHPALGVLLSSHWVALLSHVSMRTVQEELEDGTLLPSCLPGMPVAVWAQRAQLQPAAEAGCSAAGQATAGDEFEGFFSDQEQQPPDQPMLVVGSVVELSGKRLRTALDFSQPAQGGHEGGVGIGVPGRQRDSMAMVRIAHVPVEGGGSGGDGEEPLTSPGSVELQYSCSKMWRITGASAQIFSTSSPWVPADQQQQQAAEAQEAKLYPVHGYCTGATWLFGGGVGAGEGEGTTLLCIQLLHLELLALATLSGDPALLAAAGRSSSSPGKGGARSLGSAATRGITDKGQDVDPYCHLSNCWAASACQVAAGASADGQQLGVLLTATTARAVVHSLVHGWSHRQLGEELGCGKHQAASLVQSFLAAFPRLGEWWEATAKGAERRGFVTTLARRQRAVAISAKADAMARARIHKIMMQFMLGGTVADFTKAALVAVDAVASTSTSAPNGSSPQAGPGCKVVLAWGSNLVVQAAEGSVHSAAVALKQGLQQLVVGRQAVAVAARLTAGRSLHFLSQGDVC